MGDWLGLAFLLLLLGGALMGLKALSRTRTRTAEEFEKAASEAITGAGALSNALQEAFDPAAERGRIVVEQLKDGRYGKKRREGKSAGPEDSDTLQENRTL